MKFDDGNIDRVERGIAPPMKEAITIPTAEPFDGIAVYVASSPFVQGPSQHKELIAIARLIVAAPKMLDALRHASAALQEEAELRSAAADPEYSRPILEAIEKAEAAMAKAEGRSLSIMSAHWRIVGEFDSDVGVEIRDWKDELVCEIEPFTGDWTEEEIGRAHLIAAAPDLRNSTQAASNLLQALLLGREAVTDDLIQEVAAALQGAINKSEGK